MNTVLNKDANNSSWSWFDYVAHFFFAVGAVYFFGIATLLAQKFAIWFSPDWLAALL